MGIAELIQLALLLAQNGAALLQAGEKIYESLKRSGEMTPEELAKFSADFNAAKTDPAWTPDAT
jgi:hypothetical protein